MVCGDASFKPRGAWARLAPASESAASLGNRVRHMPVLYCRIFRPLPSQMKHLSPAQLDQLGQQARQSPRLRANHNLHPQLDDPIQRLAIAMQPATYVRPHRHPHTWELLYPLRGRFVVLYFDDNGSVTDRLVLGDDAAVVENPAGQWHAVLSLDDGGVIFEVKHGPYQAIAEPDYAPWSPPADSPAAAALNRWYATAAVGDGYPG